MSPQKEDAMAVIQHEMTIGEAADQLSSALPGHRVEILQGRLTATPPADGEHALSLTWVMRKFFAAGDEDAGLRSVQGVGLWLPTGPEDYAVPDFALVEEDFLDAKVQKNCYAPHVFRLVIEITSSNWADDLGTKVDTYAQAGVPVYLVADRRHQEVLLYTQPRGKAYKSREVFKRGMAVLLPESLGVSVELSVDRLLDGEGPDAP
ncbi:Uma2 family endonuclease [Streptomyces sp. NPDC101132]|uniref:Uma2 family endonuclease n=1 Tax=Streptomyces sp. NPDC101132 TaxID=3366110 RepID=UPI00382041E5